MSGKTNRNAINIALFLLIFSLMISSVSALEDFSVTTYQTKLDVCACGTEPVDYVTVANTGDSATTYYVSFEGSASAWANAIPAMLTLEPGESEIVKIYVTPTCNVRGNYELTTKVSSALLTRSIGYGVSVKKCPNIAVIPLTATHFISEPCKPITYEFQLKNTGGFPETYDISLENGNEWISLSHKSISLPGNENWTIDVYVNPGCEVYGKFSQSLIIKAQKSKFATKIPLKYDILRNYQFDLIPSNYREVTSGNETEMQLTEAGSSYKICEKIGKTIPFVIQNLVEINNDYRVEFDGNSWAKLEGNFLSLEGMQKGIVNVLMEPPLGTHGNFSFVMKAFSEKGKMVDTEEFNVEVRPCYSIDLEIDAEEDVQWVCQDDDIHYNVKILNYGEFDEEVELSMSGSSCVSMGSETVNVAAYGEEQVSLNFDANCEEKGEKEIIINAELTSEPRIKAEDGIKLNIQSLEDCYKTNVQKQWFYIEGGDGRNVNVENVGVKATSYTTLLEGPEWVTVTEDSKNFVLGQDETKEVVLLFNPTENVQYGLYRLTVQANANDVVVYSRKSVIQYGPLTFLAILGFYWYYFVLGVIIIATVIVKLIKKLKDRARKYSEKEWVIVNKGDKNFLEVEKNLAVTTVGFTAKKDLNNVKLTVEQFKKNKSKVFLHEKVYKYFEVKCENLDEKDLKEALIKFKVEKAWLDKNKLNQNQIALKKLVNGRWINVDIARSKSDHEYVFYNYNGRKFSHFAITAKIEKKVEPKKVVAVAAKKVEPKAVAKKATKETTSELKKQDKKMKTFLVNTVITMLVLAALIMGIMFGYVYYIVGGIVGLLIIIGIISLVNYAKKRPKVKKVKEKKVEPKKVEPKKVVKKEKKAEQPKTDKKEKFEFKKEYLLGVVVLLVMIAIVIGLVKIQPQGIWDQINLTYAETPDEVEGEEIEGVEVEGIEIEGEEIIPEEEITEPEEQVEEEEETLTEDEIKEKEDYLQGVLDETVEATAEEKMREDMINSLLEEQEKAKNAGSEEQAEEEEVILEQVIEEYAEETTKKTFFNDYKDYIIAGVGILIVLIIFFNIKEEDEKKDKKPKTKIEAKKPEKKKVKKERKKSMLWKSVMDFFLEEDEQPKKDNNKKKKAKKKSKKSKK